MAETNQAMINDQLGKLDGIYDVIPPTMPVVNESGNLISITAIAVLILSFVAVYLWRSRSCRYIARYQLQILARSIKQQEPDQRQNAYRLAEILRNGLQLNSLGLDTGLPSTLSTDESRWKRFVEILSQARYSRDGIEAEPFGRLVQEARHWLKHWP